jgi:hypothetical protein
MWAAIGNPSCRVVFALISAGKTSVRSDVIPHRRTRAAYDLRARRSIACWVAAPNSPSTGPP